MSKPLVSVVIPTYRRHDQLTRLLGSIKDSDYPLSSIECVVVDNAGDIDPAILQSTFPSTRVINPGYNSWSNGARRIGTEAAQGQYVFHVDDDNVVEPHCITALVGALEDDPRLGVVGPVMLVDDTDRVLSIGARISPYGIIEYVHKNELFSDVKLDPVVSGFDYLHNAIMVRRSVLENVPFDDTNFPHNWAETDFGLRVGAAGYEQACVSDAVERHFGGYDGPLTRVGPEKTYDQAKSRILFRRRHMSRPQQQLRFWLVVFPVSTLVYVWAIVKLKNDRTKTLASYFRGTVDGVREPLRKMPVPRIAPMAKSESQ